MARIVYGVAGEGYGHSTRSHVLAQRLLECGHDVLLAGSNKSLAYLREYFGQRVKEVFGLRFEIVEGRVAPLGTVVRNLKQYSRMKAVNDELYNRYLNPFKPDLVITDFEPFCARWAVRNRVPLVSIDNEHLLTHCRLEHSSGSWWARFQAEAVTARYCPGAAAYVVISFFDAPPKKSSVVVAPPVVRQAAMQIEPADGSYFVVYTSIWQDAEELADMLNAFGGHEFRIYGFDRDVTLGSCIFKPRSTEGFLRDVANSRGVVASAGFSLLSECMHFRKKILVLPLQGQYEQMINADYVEMLGLGVRSSTLDEHSLLRLIMETEKPVSNARGILWPDNEKFFAAVESVFLKLGFDIRLTG